jgi:hypothetical protein
MRLRNSGNNDKKKQKRRVPQIFSRISECNCAFAHVGKREMGSVGEDRNAIVVLESFQATAVGVQCRVALRLVGSRLHRFQPQMDPLKYLVQYLPPVQPRYSVPQVNRRYLP